jgi:hypothetical protein
LKNTTFVEAKYLYNKTLVSEGIPKSAVEGYGPNPTFLDYMPPYATTNINVAITNIAAKRVYLSEQFFNQEFRQKNEKGEALTSPRGRFQS